MEAHICKSVQFLQTADFLGGVNICVSVYYIVISLMKSQ